MRSRKSLQSVTGLSQTVSGSKNAVSEQDYPRHVLLARRLAHFLQSWVWPLTIITVGVLSSIVWSAALVWFLSRALW